MPAIQAIVATRRTGGVAPAPAAIERVQPWMSWRIPAGYIR